VRNTSHRGSNNNPAAAPHIASNEGLGLSQTTISETDDSRSTSIVIPAVPVNDSPLIGDNAVDGVDGSRGLSQRPPSAVKYRDPIVK
jgi:hypothetical protein